MLRSAFCSLEVVLQEWNAAQRDCLLPFVVLAIMKLALVSQPILLA
jgi:hypothetical protein